MRHWSAELVPGVFAAAHTSRFRAAMLVGTGQQRCLTYGSSVQASRRPLHMPSRVTHTRSVQASSSSGSSSNGSSRQVPSGYMAGAQTPNPLQQQQQQPPQPPRRQPRQRRSVPKLLEKREAMASQQQQLDAQQQQQQQSQYADEGGGWYSEQQPVGTGQLGQWQDAPVALNAQQLQLQQYSQAQWLQEQQLLQQWQESSDGYLQAGAAAEDGYMAVPDAPGLAGMQQLEQVTVFVSEEWGDDGSGPRKRRLPAWFQQPQYLDSLALHAAIMERSGRGQLEVEAAQHIIRTASCARDAALALSAVAAVRQVALSQGRVDPWPDSFVKAFVQMTVVCDCHDVLVSAMQRPNELGFVFKHKSLAIALKHWGASLALHKLEAIIHAAAGAGLRPDARQAYVLVRAAVNAKRWDKLDAALSWFAERGVVRYKPAMERLLAAAANERAAAAAGSAGLKDTSADASEGVSGGAAAAHEGA